MPRRRKPRNYLLKLYNLVADIKANADIPKVKVEAITKLLQYNNPLLVPTGKKYSPHQLAKNNNNEFLCKLLLTNNQNAKLINNLFVLASKDITLLSSVKRSTLLNTFKFIAAKASNLKLNVEYIEQGRTLIKASAKAGNFIIFRHLISFKCVFSQAHIENKTISELKNCLDYISEKLDVLNNNIALLEKHGKFHEGNYKLHNTSASSAWGREGDNMDLAKFAATLHLYRTFCHKYLIELVHSSNRDSNMTTCNSLHSNMRYILAALNCNDNLIAAAKLPRSIRDIVPSAEFANGFLQKISIFTSKNYNLFVKFSTMKFIANNVVPYIHPSIILDTDIFYNRYYEPIYNAAVAIWREYIQENIHANGGTKIDDALHKEFNSIVRSINENYSNMESIKEMVRSRLYFYKMCDGAADLKLFCLKISKKLEQFAATPTHIAIAEPTTSADPVASSSSSASASSSINSTTTFVYDSKTARDAASRTPSPRTHRRVRSLSVSRRKACMQEIRNEILAKALQKHAYEIEHRRTLQPIKQWIIKSIGSMRNLAKRTAAIKRLSAIIQSRHAVGNNMQQLKEIEALLVNLGYKKTRSGQSISFKITLENVSHVAINYHVKHRNSDIKGTIKEIFNNLRNLCTDLPLDPKQLHELMPANTVTKPVL